MVVPWGLITLYCAEFFHNKTFENLKLKVDSNPVPLLQRERKMLWEEAFGTQIHGCWGTVIAIIITSAANVYGTLTLCRACAGPQLTLAITHKESTAMSILQVRILRFRKIREDPQGQTDKWVECG